MKLSEMRAKSDTEIQGELLALRKVQFSLRMQVATQQLNDNSQIGKARKDIARIKTLQREKVLAK
ncbi:MAG: 50S ribosomal protein L29 [Rugosibacter sp.]|jgi:large subunit ribosomal protein L29